MTTETVSLVSVDTSASFSLGDHTISDTMGWSGTHYCGSWCNHSWPTYYNYTYSWPTTIYMYQVKCPKCKTMNFMQLDVITPCKKCASKIKAVSNKADFEVPVEV